MTKLLRTGAVKLALAAVVGVPVLMLGACAPVPPPGPCDACALAAQAQATANQALATAQQALARSSVMYQRGLVK